MQTPNWYWRRMRSMSAEEIAWRLRHRLGNAAEGILWPVRRREPPLLRILATGDGEAIESPRVLGGQFRAADFAYSPDESTPWRSRLVGQANRILDHRLTLFDLIDHPLGDEINWNYEYQAGKATPMRRSNRLDYRNFASVGDCKLVWEPNRHYQLVVLARAFRVTGEERYAVEIIRQLESWMRQCPYGYGMNWRSPLELGVRLINWVWTMGLIEGCRASTESFRRRLWICVYRHLQEITRNYSGYTSANNHLVGEAAGVFIASSYFPGLQGASRRRLESRAILAEEILRQTFPDGGTREQATGYHLFVLEFFTLAGLVARNGGLDFPTAYWQRLEGMYAFLAALSEGGEGLPMIGDCDDGYVLDLGGRDDRVASLLCIGAILFDRADFRVQAGAFREPAHWLFGPEGRQKFERMDQRAAPRVIGPRSFADSGYYLLQRGRKCDNDRISILFDCGELGFLSIAGHGHADALSLVLRAGGCDVLVDPGTYDYFTHPAWRRYFRSTRAHNSVVVDEADQSEMLGPFLWGRRARANRVRWAPTEGGGTVVGEHDGYASLADPVIHLRSVTLADEVDVVLIRDELLCDGVHAVTMCWHFAEQCAVRAIDDRHFEARFATGSAVLELDSRLRVLMIRGGEHPIAGWVSRGYHRRSPATTLLGTCELRGRTTFETRVELRFAPCAPPAAPTMSAHAGTVTAT